MNLWRKLLICFVSLTTFLTTCALIVIACGGEFDPYDYYTSFFHSDVQGKKDYGPFYFTEYQFTYNDEEPGSEPAINSSEWEKYLGKPVKANDVEKVMYQLDAAGQERAMAFLEKQSALPDSLSANSFLQALNNPKNASAKKYYEFAKEIEYLSDSDYDYWDPKPRDTVAQSEAGTRAMDLAGQENDSFIKLRYFYQAQKLHHYAAEYEEANQIYDQYIAGNRSDSHVKGWALALKAGEQRRLGDTLQAAYQFSQVFARYPERRLQAYRNYHYMDPRIAEVIKLAKRPEEKANLYAIEGFSQYQMGTENLEKVYANTPESSLVGVLLVREINKLEEYYLTPSLINNTDEFYSRKPKTVRKAAQIAVSEKSGNIGWPVYGGGLALIAGIIVVIIGLRKPEYKVAMWIAGGVLIAAGIGGAIFVKSENVIIKSPDIRTSEGSFFVTMPDSLKNEYENHIEKLRQFCVKLNDEQKYPEPRLGHITNAYLYFMQNKPEDGLKALSEIDEKGTKDKLGDQQQLVKLLLTAQQLKTIVAVDEVALLPSLKWLESKVDTKDVQFANTKRNFYTHILAPAYLRQHDTAKAALALLHTKDLDLRWYNRSVYGQLPDLWYNFLQEPELRQLMKWKLEPSADPYMAFLTTRLKKIHQSTLYELLGTIQLRDHRYEDAFASFKSEKANPAPKQPGEQAMTSGNPFAVTINDYPQQRSKGISKLEFAKQMSDLQKALKATPNDPEMYFRLATGIYQTSTYGNSWNMISYVWSSYDYARDILYAYDADYINTSTAKQYYLRARSLSQDPEFKAKCTFMAAKCEQKEFHAPSYRNYESYKQAQKTYSEMLRNNKYFKELMPYESTRFYRKAVAACSYLSDFLDK